MAVVTGINAGFVTEAPSSDPGGTVGGDLGNYAIATRDVSPDGSYQVTEMGFWQDDTNNSACNIRMGFYSHDAVNDLPNVLIDSYQASGSVPANTSAWIRITELAIALPETPTTRWLAFGSEDVSTDINTNWSYESNKKHCWEAISGPVLNGTWSGAGGGSNTPFNWSIYALYVAAGGETHNLTVTGAQAAQHTIGAIILSQVHALTVAGLLHSHTIGAVQAYKQALHGAHSRINPVPGYKAKSHSPFLHIQPKRMPRRIKVL